MNDKNEQNARIYNVPASAIKVNGNKLNYMKYLSETQKKFYSLMLQKRYDLILKPAYKRAEKREN